MSPADDHLSLHARDVRFDWSSLPVCWIPGEPVATHLLDVLHLLLPEGERWFVRVFTAALPLVRDDRLAEDVRGFVGQEMVHATSHEGALEHLTAAGLRTTSYVEQIRHLFGDLLGDRDLDGDDAREWLVERVAFVAAIEHLTAVLGAWILDSPALDAAGADPTMLDMLRWHGAEEVEHRAVAHDLYMHLDGRYLRRVRALTICAPVLLRLWAAGVVVLCRSDPAFTGRVRLRHYLRASRRGLCPGPWRLARWLVGYLRPGYHPSRHGDTDAAVAYLATSPAARAAEQR
jgi:uncharacterized protein